MNGTAYLLHLNRPYKHARHYIGWSTNLQGRLADHAAGRGAKLLQAARRQGITWRLARTWEDVPQARETQLTRQGGGKRLCPICKEGQ